MKQDLIEEIRKLANEGSLFLELEESDSNDCGFEECNDCNDCNLEDCSYCPFSN